MFKRAERKQAKLKLALTGPSGSGKSLSALYLASGLGSKIAVVDTENDSASLYSGYKDVPEFDICTIDAPYTVAKYSDSIKDAITSGYDVLIVDSISHAWAGEGGLLAKKESLDSRGGNSFSNWSSITKEHEAFKSLLLNADIHIIVTMRSKQDYVLETNDKGKQQPRKVGLAPVQRDGIEYEFTTVLDIGMNHQAVASKDRTGLFDGQIFTIDRSTGERLRSWLSDGKIEVPKVEPVELYEETPEQKNIFAKDAAYYGITDKAELKEISAALREKKQPMKDIKLGIENYIKIPFG